MPYNPNDRYLAIFRLDDSGESVALAEERADRAIRLAQRMNTPGEWWEVVDRFTGNLIASSHTPRAEE